MRAAVRREEFSGFRDTERPAWFVDVVDPDGGPVSGVVVTLLREDVDSRCFRTEWTAVTDVDGRVRFDEGGDVCDSALADHPDFAPTISYCGWGDDSDEIPVIALPEATTFRGRVVEYESGAPIVGARLVVHSWTWEDFDDGWPLAVETNADGRFTLPRVPVADLSVMLYREGFSFANDSVRLDEFLGTEYELVVARGATYAGRVVDVETGLPISGVRIVSEGTETDAEGRFDLSGKERDGRLFFSRDGFANTIVWCRHLDLDARSQVVVPLFRACGVEGVVLDAVGRPVSGVRVDFEPTTRQGPTDPIVSRFAGAAAVKLTCYPAVPWPRPMTGDDGRFVLHGLNPSADPIRITGCREADDRRFASPPVLLDRPGALLSNVTLEPRALGAVTVTVAPASTRWCIELHAEGEPIREECVADGDVVEFEDVPVGRARLLLVQHRRLFNEIEEFVPERRVLDETEVVVRADTVVSHAFAIDRGRDAVVAGRVRRPDGRPVAGVWVDAWEPVGTRHRVRTGADGRFRFEVRSPFGEDVQLDGWVGTSTRITQSVRPGDESVLFVMPELRRVALRLIDHTTGYRVSGADLRYSWRDPSGPDSLEDEFEFDAAYGARDPVLELPIGVVSLGVDASAFGYEPVEIERFEVFPGEGRMIREIRLEPAR